MKDNSQDKAGIIAKLKQSREMYLPYNDKTLRRLVLVATVMYAWLLIWALVFKLGIPGIMITNYTNLKDMTLDERIMWDVIPFNYRGEGAYQARLIMDTVLNCFVFSPFGIALSYLFKKQNILRDISVCLVFSFFIETLQLLTLIGNPATEDLITNTAGYFIGIGIYHLTFKRLSTKAAVRTFAVIVIAFALATVFSLVTMAISAELIFKIMTKTL